uniref:Uncharacterized protein n=1 Tax=Arundo donax TaxID=35708 RepID=A0A0A9C3I3_ARUDO
MEASRELWRRIWARMSVWLSTCPVYKSCLCS